jgi:hypothetical protein
MRKGPAVAALVAACVITLVGEGSATTPNPTATPIEPNGCGEICDGRSCYTAVCGGQLASGHCTRSGVRGCECQVFECFEGCCNMLDSCYTGGSFGPGEINRCEQAGGFYQIDLRCDEERGVCIPWPTPTPINSTPSLTPTPLLCGGDCNRDEEVAVDDLVIIVAIALGQAGADACVSADTDANDHITVDEIVTAVDAALNGCQTPTPTPTCAPPPAGRTCTQFEVYQCVTGEDGCPICDCCNFEGAGGCCQLSGGCFRLDTGGDAARCNQMHGSFFQGCPIPATCDASTGLCKSSGL